MPIKRERRHLYGERKAWLAIKQAIRERANYTCENAACGAVHGQPHPTNGKKTVITTAHLDHDETNNDFSNLRALCAPCHLAYDTGHHAKNAAITRRAKLKTRDMFEGGAV